MKGEGEAARGTERSVEDAGGEASDSCGCTKLIDECDWGRPRCSRRFAMLGRKGEE